MEERSQEIKDKLEEILYPKKTPEFKITLIFRTHFSEKYKKAVELAKKSPTYREEECAEGLKHYVTFTPEEVEELFQLFNLVHDFEDLEILINHKKLPYAHQLWIPLMWFYRI
ncbi:hypothetical protein NLC26_01135 [Candidatus Aminicenantes bacterium AC-708-M15]|jgi:hypothetical protein|nr:hypothetical protein [SCandidatus Aminicenantes bacterium Aminicenantia_JdfR_composite]MCP2597284.1 hypothetical protein [Candidatus Aminicenantes bacterium AC-335-G13]MCP2598410.1 hypothetical protein [Candidatus Aminicenantes bacterium AC-335-L06]MCP2604063.1 hypothetical protein [Candidatus Aminicenantes bacterium AC-708-M15]MCP2605887.1 hypothetical protein [Candidatus Aminicenantes bacterium AC-335-O07]MCP2618306.1 hypothetical protein [Candidatus Aminicenantes bacterium AC-335-A11]MC